MMTPLPPTTGHHRPPTPADVPADRPVHFAVVAAYFRDVAAADRPARPEDRQAIVTRHIRTGSERPQSAVVVRLHLPPAEVGPGRPTGCAVIEIVTDDQPLLVDAVVGAVTACGVTVGRRLHPVLEVYRSPGGALEGIRGAAGATAEPGTTRECWLNLQIDGDLGSDRAAAIETAVHRAIRAIRGA